MFQKNIWGISGIRSMISSEKSTQKSEKLGDIGNYLKS
jgi:hypothetical protein